MTHCTKLWRRKHSNRHYYNISARFPVVLTFVSSATKTQMSHQSRFIQTAARWRMSNSLVLKELHAIEINECNYSNLGSYILCWLTDLIVAGTTSLVTHGVPRSFLWVTMSKCGWRKGPMARVSIKSILLLSCGDISCEKSAVHHRESAWPPQTKKIHQLDVRGNDRFPCRVLSLECSWTSSRCINYFCNFSCCDNFPLTKTWGLSELPILGFCTFRIKPGISDTRLTEARSTNEPSDMN